MLASFGVDEKCHDHGTDQAGRCTGTHTQDHLIGILQVGHICGKTGDQAGSAVFVDVGKEKVWMLVYMAFRRFLAKPVEASAPYFPPMTPDQSPHRARTTITPPIR